MRDRIDFGKWSDAAEFFFGTYDCLDQKPAADTNWTWSSSWYSRYLREDDLFEGFKTDATRELSSLAALRERVAAGYLNAGQPAQAIAQYDAILAVARNAPYRASIEYQAAQVEIGQGNVAGGHLRLQRIIRDYPETSPAYRALGILLGAGLQVESYLQARINFANGDYGAAIQALNAHSSENGFSSVEALMMLGRAYREVGNPQAAITTFQTVLDTYPTNPIFGEAWLEQGRTLFLSGDVAGAIQKYTALQ